MNSTNLQIIKNALSQINYEKCFLFGSQARGSATEDSDYDLLVIIHGSFTQSEKYSTATKIRKYLAEYLISADVIVKTDEEARLHKVIAGSVVRNALLEGVEI